MMRKYENYGGFEIPRKNKIVDHASLEGFWNSVEQEEGLSSAKGCYVFAVKAGRGMRPWYVGQAGGERGFKQEVFGDHKLKHYNGLISGQRGTPFMFFIAAKTAKDRFRKVSGLELNWVENFLISLAVEANGNLLNKKNTGLLQECSIPGLLNSPKGAPAKMTSKMKKLFSC